MYYIDGQEHNLLRPKIKTQTEPEDDNEEELPEAWRLRNVDTPPCSQGGWNPRKRGPEAMDEPEGANPHDMDAMSRLFSWVLKHSAFDHYGLIHTAGGWFDLGEVLSADDKFHKYSINDVKRLVATSYKHPERTARFELTMDTVEYHKAYFIRATSKKRRFN